jgi:hypothetical protein
MTSGPSRRQIAKGAAWAVPAVSVAAAAPTLSASPTDPGCGCLQTGGVNTFTAQAVTVLNLGTVTGTTVFNLDSSNCDTGFFQPAYTVVGLGGYITWATGQANTSFTVGGTTGAGTIGAISAFTSTFTTLGQINMPNDLISPYTPRVPASICFSFTSIFIPLLPIPQVECTYDMCIPLTNPSSIGAVIAGTGTVNWSDLTMGTPTLTPR